MDQSLSASRPGIRELITAHHAAVFRYAYRLTGSQPDAEDLTQQTFLTAQQKLHQLRDPARSLAWLYAVLRSCFLKSRRKLSPQLAGNLDFDVEGVAANDLAAPDLIQARFDRQAVQAAIHELPDEFKLVVLMFYFEDQSYKQIAAELNLPVGTVMSRLSRAKSRLRGLLAGFDVAGGSEANNTSENCPANAKSTPQEHNLPLKTGAS